MGQKVHPLGFRMGSKNNYRSNWFIQPSFYSNMLFQDYLIRQNIVKYFDTLNTSKNKKVLLDSINITDIRISRKFDQVHISIFIASLNKILYSTSSSKSNLKSTVESMSIVDKLQNSLTKQLLILFKDNKNFIDSSKLVIIIKETENINTNATFITKCLIDDLENRVPFRRALKSIIDISQKQKTLLGIKIKVSGRLNGIEMARSEWVRKGQIPLQTINANIEYYNGVAQTKYGLLGVKVWIYKGNNK
jgi:small subunit ribosomal protein S3